MAAWTLLNADIVSALPILADFHEKADSGSTTTLVSARLIDATQAELVGAKICFLSGANDGTDSVITAFVEATGTVTFDAITAIDNTVVFGVVYLDFTSYVNRAYSIIKNDMRDNGLDIDLFLTVVQVKEIHLTKTLELICMSKRQDATEEDTFHELYLEFKKTYSRDIINLKADYDLNESGVIDSTEELSTNQVVFNK